MGSPVEHQEKKNIYQQKYVAKIDLSFPMSVRCPTWLDGLTVSERCSRS